MQMPYRIAADTWIVPQLEQIGPDTLASINSMVIAGAEPVIVDTGCAINRDRWLNQVFSIVDPADVRWVYLSHAEGCARRYTRRKVLCGKGFSRHGSRMALATTLRA
jgi:hypothetical protein